MCCNMEQIAVYCRRHAPIWRKLSGAADIMLQLGGACRLLPKMRYLLEEVFGSCRKGAARSREVSGGGAKGAGFGRFMLFLNTI